MSEPKTTPTGTEAAKDPIVIVNSWLERQQKQLTAAIPKNLFTADHQIRLALTCLRRQPDLLPLVATPQGLQSFLGAVMSASQLGLALDGLLGQASLVPFKGKIQLVVGYKGHIVLAMRSGQVKSLDAHLVYELDDFEMEYGTSMHLRHVPLLAPVEDRGRLVGAYAIAHLMTGGTVFEVMSIEEIEEIEKEFSKAKSGPWKEPIARRQMIRKTPIRRLSNYLPLSPEQQRAVTLDEMAGMGIAQNLDRDVIEPEFTSSTADTSAGDDPPPPVDTDDDAAAKTAATTDALKGKRAGDASAAEPDPRPH